MGSDRTVAVSHLVLVVVLGALAGTLVGCDTKPDKGTTLPKSAYDPPKQGPSKGPQVGHSDGKKIQ